MGSAPLGAGDLPLIRHPGLEDSDPFPFEHRLLGWALLLSKSGS
jgi:hypothetical protein